eukprot:762961-Hanusia_phi.AAC.19
MLNQYAGLKQEVAELRAQLKRDENDMEALRDALDEVCLCCDMSNLITCEQLEIYKCKAPPEFSCVAVSMQVVKDLTNA